MKFKSFIFASALLLAALAASAADFPVPFNTELDVQNPIALAWEARGRLWVAENYTYAERTTKFELRLRDRAGKPADWAAATKELLALFDTPKDPVHQLRALWVLNALSAADEAFLLAQTRHANEHIRAWAVRLLTDAWPLDTVMSQRPVSLLGANARNSQSLLTSAATLRG
jgi:hypothetical protein